MKITFSQHALLKLAERNLSQEFVIKTIKDPDFILPSRGNRERAYKRFRNNYLEVIFVKERESTIVITAHWVAKIARKK
ncbi:MAG: DUF4258 domain-containing protein [bacterium]|nr:DUF4258 domain-containing protein [bacterium]MDP2704309.1 DUF4258 domain-containing protein [bacterium]